jgi:hypothetical protein
VKPLSFRTLERVVAYISIFVVSKPPLNLRLPQLVVGLSVMKVVAPELYSRARTGKLSFTEADNLFRVGHWGNQRDRHVGEDFEKWWRYGLGELSNQELTSECERIIRQKYSYSPPSDLIPHFCDIIDGLSFPGPIGTEEPPRS